MSNKSKYFIGIIILLFIACFFMGRCSKRCEIQEVKIPVIIPAKSGSFKSPQILVPINTKEVTKIVYLDSTIFVPTLNQELVDKYIETKSELDKLQQYTEAVRINSYETVFDNKDVKLTIKTKTEGKLLELIPEYTVKKLDTLISATIPKPKEKVFSMNIGAGLQTTKDLNKLDPTVNLDFVNKKGYIIGGSYSINGVISVKATIPLFSIKN